MQQRLFGIEFQATVTAYDTASAVIGSVSVSGITQQNMTETTVPVIGATSPVPIAKLVLTSQLIVAPTEKMFVFGTIYFNAGMSVCTSARPFGDP
jgi:prolyl-tRNA editing enzyme YbaK/EbsC (Cys-tRNA(Pro) deacylase)